MNLLLDLRFNRRRFWLGNIYLASMIYAQAGKGDFYQDKFNQNILSTTHLIYLRIHWKFKTLDLNVVGEEPINRLNTLSRLYVLTTGSTASASELLINGLRPYMSSVKLSWNINRRKKRGFNHII